MPKLTRKPPGWRNNKAKSDSIRNAMNVPGSINAASSVKPHPELLRSDSESILSIGVDLGTSSTSAVFAVVDKNNTCTTVQCIEKAKPMRTTGYDIRFPTLVALRKDYQNPSYGRLVFASDACKALANGEVSVVELFEFGKLGLKQSVTDIVDEDRSALENLQERLYSITQLSKGYSKIEAVYPDKPDQKTTVELNSVGDLIQQILRYFLGLLKVNVGSTLAFQLSEVETMFALENVEVSFAVPSIWSDLDICKFVTLIEKAGWPTRIKVWSEAKTAAIAHIAHTYAKEKTVEGADKVRRAYLNRAIVLCDIGGGTLDLTTIVAVEIGNECIKFASLAKSIGSLCGGCVLDSQMAKEVRTTLGMNFQVIKHRASDGSIMLTDEDFLRNFKFEACRQDFVAEVGKRYIVEYDGNALPAHEYPSILTRAGVRLTGEQLVNVHNRHIDRILQHIRRQIRTTEAEAKGRYTGLTVAICGGVTRSPYLLGKIKDALSAEEIDVIVIEQTDQSLVALGCLLCLRQLDVGGRAHSREALGIPIAVRYNPRKHAQTSRVRNRQSGYPEAEARDIPNWIVKINDPTQGKSYSDEITLVHAFYEDDGRTKMLTDPRNDDLVIDLKFMVISTTQDDDA